MLRGAFDIFTGGRGSIKELEAVSKEGVQATRLRCLGEKCSDGYQDLLFMPLPNRTPPDFYPFCEMRMRARRILLSHMIV